MTPGQPERFGFPVFLRSQRRCRQGHHSILCRCRCRYRANTLIDGGALADNIIFAGANAVTTTVGSATIAGGAGADTIQFSGGVTLNQGFILAGDGQDSVAISAAFNGGTLNGGAGADTISLGTFAVSGSNVGYIQGGAGADKFDLGTFGVTMNSGVSTYNSGGSTLGYASFDESNLAGLDFASAAYSVNVSGNTTFEMFQISQDVVTATIATNVGNPASFTATNGTAVFTSTFDNTLTARAVEIDRILAKGQTLTFTDGSGNRDFLFIQGGSSSGGNGDDLIVEIETAVGAIALAAGNTSIAIRAVQA